MSVNVDLRMAEDEAGPLGRFPAVSDGERDRLVWYVAGDFRITVDGQLVTRSPLAVDGYLREYLWMVARAFNEAIADVDAGEPTTVSLFDNPGTFELLPRDDELLVRFDSQTREKQVTECGVDPAEFSRAVLDATDELIGSARAFNPSLENSGLITALESAVSRNRARLE